MKKNKLYDIHHLIPRSRKPEGYDTTHELNLKRMQKSVHQRIHALFSNMTPQEQLEFIYDLNKAVLSQETRVQLQDIIFVVKEKFYRAEVLSNDEPIH